MLLFDQMVRSNPDPCGYLESSFEFLNRVDQPYWCRVRNLIENWFSLLPEAEKADVRARYRSKDFASHTGSWWEMYLESTFRSMKFKLERHPSLTDTSRHPDFLVSSGEDHFYVEATISECGPGWLTRHDAERWVLSQIDSVKCSDFVIFLDFKKRSDLRPKASEIVRPIDAWVNSPDRRDQDEVEIEAGGWVFGLTAFERSDAANGTPSRLIAAGPGNRGGFLDEAAAIRRSLNRKKSRYGTLGAPYIIAVLPMSGLVDLEDVLACLFGDEAYRIDPNCPEAGTLFRRANGFWIRPGGPTATRVSAVLIGREVRPHTIGATWPELWLNPFAAHPLTVDLPFPTFGIDGERIKKTEATTLPANLFGLDAEWPGPDHPFSRN